MKKSIISLVLIVSYIGGFAQKDTTGFVFTTIKENKITSVKNQNRSSTCWAYSALGFLEAELLRLNKGDCDFSEMFVVYHTMLDRAVNYVRLHGDASFSPGGSFYDVLYCWRHYGIVPDKAMPAGVMYGDTLANHIRRCHSQEYRIENIAFVATSARGNLRDISGQTAAGVYL